MNWSDIAIPFIKGFEKCELVAYHGAADRPGLYSCGWGSTGPDVNKNTVWTQGQADARLTQKVDECAAHVDEWVKVELTSYQKASLVSFCYNVGLYALENSTLLRLLNNGKYDDAARQFQFWNHANGLIVDGLTRRRHAEMELFNTKDGS